MPDAAPFTWIICRNFAIGGSPYRPHYLAWWIGPAEECAITPESIGCPRGIGRDGDLIVVAPNLMVEIVGYDSARDVWHVRRLRRR